MKKKYIFKKLDEIVKQIKKCKIEEEKYIARKELRKYLYYADGLELDIKNYLIKLRDEK